MMAHFALTDVDGKRFRFSERFSRSALGLAGAGGSPLKVWLEGWSATETQARPWSMKLSAAEAEMAIDLELKSLTSVILNGESGLSRKSATPGNSSYYYSIPRMQTSGTVRSGNDTYRVAGVSWLDREWSTSALERDQVGWDWFALHLDDGRDIMFYRLRKRDGTVDPFSSGTLVMAGGKTRHIEKDDVQLEIGRWLTSPASGARYPSLWRMRIPSHNLELEITPRLPDQELRARFRYWEGAVAVKGAPGSPSGEGYLEMTGYGAEPK
jgi:predicted secreted hydrolase